MWCRKTVWYAVGCLCLVLGSVSYVDGGQYEPDEGVYLGVIHEGMSGTDISSFQSAVQKDSTVFGCYVNITQAMADVTFHYYFTNWAASAKSAAPGAGILVVMEPKGCFTNFFVNWQPGSQFYEVARNFGYMLRDTDMPVFLCFAHEANGSWYDWSPDHSATDPITTNTYRQAWSNLSTLVKSVATNVAMVWSMNPEGDVSREALYPGDDVVDWVGLSAYNGQEYGNQRNEVVDHQLQYKLESGYWDTYCDFYSIFTATNGHNKPMMITETGCYAPVAGADSNFPFSTSVVLAEFNTLWAGTTNIEGVVDDCSSLIPPWGDRTPWDGQGAFMTMYCSNGCLIIDPVNYRWGDYVDGAMQAWTNGVDWSNITKLRVQIRRGTDTTKVNPVVLFQFRSHQHSNEVDVADISAEISSSGFVVMDAPTNAFTYGGNFSWSDVRAMTIRVKSSGYQQVPGDVIIDYISRFYDAPEDDQQWSAVQFKSGAVSNDWSIQGGSLHVSGTSNGDDEMCESYFTLANNQNWGAYNNLYLRLRKGSAATPRLYVKVRDNDGDEGVREFAVTNSSWQPYVIPVKSLAPYDDFNWDNVSRVTFLVGGDSGQSVELYVDEMSLGMYPTNIHYETPTETKYDKENWLYQLFSVNDYSSELRPVADGIRTNFPQVHMINYFNVDKFESGVQKDFRITANADLLGLYNTLTADDYFLVGIGNVVPDLNMSTGSLQIKRGEQDGMTVCLAEAPVVPVTLSIEKTSGDSTLSISGGGTQHVFNASNWSVNWELTFSAADPEDHANGSAVYSFVCGEEVKGTLNVDAVGGYSWHVPSNAEPAGHTMRDPVDEMAAMQSVSFYNGTYANTFTQNGSTFYYRKTGETAWNTITMGSAGQSVSAGVTSEYWQAAIIAGTYSPGDSIEYYMEITYDNCADTYLGTPDGGTSCEFYLTAAEAQSHLFSYSYAEEYTINASAGIHGGISPAGSVAVTAGDDKMFAVTASNLYRIADILTNGASIGVSFANSNTSYQFTWNNVTANGTISASFAEMMTTNTPVDVPEVWLETYYPQTTNFEQVAVSDTDDDALSAWQEYIAGTDPTSAGSTLQTESPADPGESEYPVVRWLGTAESGRTYSIMWKNDLLDTWSELATDIVSAYPAMNVYTDTVHSTEQVNYYRVKVRKDNE